MSRRQALLDGEDGPSDDYIAYASGSDDRAQAGSRKKKMIAGVIGLIGLLAIAAAIVWFIVYREEEHHDDPIPSDIPQIALSYFLVQNVRPWNYTVAFNADPDTGLFDGDMLIEAQILPGEPVSAFYLHSLYLNIKSLDLMIDQVSLNHTDFKWGLNGQIESTASSANAQQNLWIESLTGHPFNVTNQLQIKISYNGTMPSTSSNGFYRTSYQTADGVTNWIGATQFEPTHARRAFPCFDEPAMKATWNIQISVPSKFKTVLSNGEIVKQTTSNNMMTTMFSQTPKQSSYLIAFIITNFEYVTSQVPVAKGGTSYPFRGWGRVDNNKYLTLQFMTDQASQFQQEFHSLMDVTYPINKLDQAAVSGRGGAMENYGLVLYAEARLYVDNDTNSAVLEQAFNTNSHELAHFLFGDYMTPMWWSNNWLKEGSATFWSYVTIQQVMINQGFGDWNTDSLAVISYQEGALIADSNMNSPPLHDHGVETPYQIANHFGTITYNKGGSFLRMIRGIMGETAFYQSCKIFLKDFALSNAWGVDFFNALSVNYPTRNLTEFLLPWAEQPGFPLVNVSVASSSTPGTNAWSISQHRYNAPETDNTRWPILLQYYVIDSNGVSTGGSQYMDAKDNAVVISAPVGSVVKMNFNRTGFYRVRYDDVTLNTIADLVHHNSAVVSTNDRVSLIHDVWQLQHDGLITNWEIVLNVTHKIMRSEQEYAPMAAALERVNDVWRRVRHYASLDDRNTWMGWMQIIIGDLARAINWGPVDNSNHITGLAQIRLGPVACKWENEACVEMADAAIFAFTFNDTFPHANIRQTVFEHSRIEIDGDTTRKFRSFYNETDSNVRASFCMNGLLAQARTDKIIQDYLEDILDGKLVLRPEDTLGSIIERFIAKNDIARNVIVTYFKNNISQWNRVRQIVGDDDAHLAMIVFSLVGSAQTSEQLSDATSFLGANIPSTSRVQRAYQDGQQEANRNIAWINNNWAQIKNWINTYQVPV